MLGKKIISLILIPFNYVITNKLPSSFFCKNSRKPLSIRLCQDYYNKLLLYFRSLHSEAVLQEYPGNPMLLFGQPFFVTFYMLVTSISPLRVYVHNVGIVSFGFHGYNKKVGHFSTKCIYESKTEAINPVKPT